MANFFTDNKDLLFQFSQLNLEEIVEILEDGYQYTDQFPGAPDSFEAALQNYQGALELAGDIAANFIGPKAQEVDQQGAHLQNGKVKYADGTKAGYEQLGQAGLTGTLIPHEYGGINFPATIYMMVIEIISRADASMMTLIGYQDVGEAIAKFGEKSLCERFLPPYAEGRHIGSMVMTEPGAGSDLQSIKLKAYQDEEGQWRLNGVKHFISNGCGDMLLVLAKSEPQAAGVFGLSLFVCPGGDKVQVTHIEEKMGLHGSPTCQLYFDDAPCYLVGKRKQGLLHVLYVLNHARFSVAAQGLGIAEAAYQEALSYTKIREQFGKLIYDMAPVRNMLIDMRVAIESCRSLLYNGAQWLDLRNNLEEKIEHLKKEGEDVSELKARFIQAAKITDLLSPLTKYIITEMAVEVCYMAQQLHGGMGYMREMNIERMVRDVRITTIYEGTSQIHIGASFKSVMNDVMAEQINSALHDQYPEASSALFEKTKSLYQLFTETKELIQAFDEVSHKEAAAKDIVDLYGMVYRAVLLLRETKVNPDKIPVAKRFINDALGKAHGSYHAIKNAKYDDVNSVDDICS